MQRSADDVVDPPIRGTGTSVTAPAVDDKRGSLGPARGADDIACLHEFFEAAALRWPDAVAVEVPPGRGRPERTVVTYAELEVRAEAIARNLQRLVTAESSVAILLPRDSDLLYAAQLGVLKAGAAYACLEPSYPDERVHALLADCAPVAVLTDAAGGARVRGVLGAERVLDAAALAAQPPESAGARVPPAWLTPSSLAYVIYTSGTTGSAKGTLIEHASIANLVASDRDEFGIAPRDRVAQNSAAVYDSSVEEVWLALAAGATLVVMDEEAVRLGPDAVDWLRRERITVLCATPTMLRTLGCREPAVALPDVQLVYVGGEPLPRDLAARWAPGRRLVNGYGPTECAVTAIRTRIRARGEVPIGVPIRGVAAWVLNEAQEAVPDGERGELWLGGIGLARGYHNRPALTAESFVVHPVLGRIYRTGDIAHRSRDGVFFCHGRRDAQVKVRGHRIELEEIEARLAGCAGVREAACCVQGAGVAQVLVGFVVPERPDVAPDEETLRAALREVLPAHMVPARIGRLVSLPRTPGDKLDRGALPPLAPAVHSGASSSVLPRTAVEERIGAVFAEATGSVRAVSVADDFFLHLGGDSLSAAVAISLLRDDPATAALAVRDLYDLRTTERLAACAVARAVSAEHGGSGNGGRGTADGGAAGGARPRPVAVPTAPPLRRPVAAALLQAAWLLKELLVTSLVAYALVFHAGPAVAARLGVIPTLLLLPLASFIGLAGYTVLAVAYAVWLKRRLIGRYEPGRVPFWGRYYLKHWIVARAAGLIPWWLLGGTEYEKTVLRALGARIGRRVHIHRGVVLQHGGWDLLDIGDDVTLGQSAAVRLTELESRAMVIGPVELGAGATLDVHAGVGPHSCVEPGGYLCAHSYLPSGGRIPRGERWDGIPARPTGETPPAAPAAGATMSPFAASCLLLLVRVGLALFLALPAQLLAIVFWRLFGAGAVAAAGGGAWLHPHVVLGAVGLAMLAVPLTLLLIALACRALGPVPAGMVSRWSGPYVRIWVKPGLVDAAGRWLYGTLFWPHWLRLAGAKVGANCEISGLIDTLPEMIDIGPRTFCADGVYLGGPHVHRGSVTVLPVTLGARVFLGNGVVVPGGVCVPDETLLGVNTVAEPATLRPHSAWFGHPPLELPRRQIVDADERATEHPTALRYTTRLWWELLRFSVPAVPIAGGLLYLAGIEEAKSSMSWPWLLAFVPLVTLGTALLPVVAAIATKWVLLGRVRPGMHPLWSCWNSRWDFYCMAWNIYMRDVSGLLSGTPFHALLLRAVGARIGRGVVLGTDFTEDLPDPDLLTIEDGATVDCLFQAHTFEDRVLKNDRVTVRRDATAGPGAVLLYGAEVGAGARVTPHSVVMKYEHLLPGKSYEGFPVRHGVPEPPVSTAC